MPRRRHTVKPALIQHETHCVECGYNLRGLNRRDACPECATPIQRSLKGSLLRHAGTRWLTRVHAGLWLLHRISVIAMFALILAPVLDIYAHLNLTTSIRLSRDVIPLTLIIWSVIACSGLWLATTPVPRADARLGLQSAIERATLLSIPINTLAWIALGMIAFGPLASALGNPFGLLGLPPPTPAVNGIILGVLVVITWLQSMVLARWLNRIDARVDAHVRRQPTILDRINQAATNSRDNPPGAAAEFWRGMANWSPLALLVIMIAGGVGMGSIPWGLLTFIVFVPLMILLTMRRTVRNVGVERAIGESTRSTLKSEAIKSN